MNCKFIILSIFIYFATKKYFLDKDKHAKQDVADELKVFSCNLYVNDKVLHLCLLQQVRLPKYLLCRRSNIKFNQAVTKYQRCFTFW